MSPFCPLLSPFFLVISILILMGDLKCEFLVKKCNRYK